MHPNKYTLDLMRIMIDHIPQAAPKAIFDEAHKDYERFTNDPSLSLANIEAAIVKVGRASWPYRKAYQELFMTNMKSRVTELFLEELRPDVREKYLKWNKAGHEIHEARSLQDFEATFSGDEKFVIEEALLGAEEAARSEFDEQIEKSRKEEFQKLVATYEQRAKGVEEKIAALRYMAKDSEKWSSEILEKVRVIEEGWSGVERDFDIYQLEKEVEYWKDTMAVDGIE